MKVEAVKLIVRDTVDRILVGQEHPSDAPVAKLAYSELNVELCEHALDLLASSSAIDADATELVERWHANFLWSRVLTISGGSSEIMRGLIGRQLLGLPRA